MYQEVHEFLVECRDYSASIFTLKGIFGDAVNSSPYLTPLIFKKVLKELAAYAKRDETANMQLFDELDQRAIAGDVSLFELGIKSGRLLSLQTEEE